jgi:hypothetical protein
MSYVYTSARDGIFACQAHRYDSDHYLADCPAPRYGDYEHGAFWFGLEPLALAAARRAHVLFIPDSRVQIAFSTPATAEWFAKRSADYYLLGFGFRENVMFIQALLQKIEPRAKVYIINIDTFFDRTESPPARIVMHESTAIVKYKAKQIWQFFHEWICGNVTFFCGYGYAVFRSRATGAYSDAYSELSAERGRNVVESERRLNEIVYDESVDHDEVRRITASASDFLPRLRVSRECLIMTSIPHAKTRPDPKGTRIATSRAVAAALGATFLAPELGGLKTFDHSHLDKPSAQRWSAAFFGAAGPRIEKCLRGGNGA